MNSVGRHIKRARLNLVASFPGEILKVLVRYARDKLIEFMELRPDVKHGLTSKLSKKIPECSGLGNKDGSPRFRVGKQDDGWHSDRHEIASFDRKGTGSCGCGDETAAIDRKPTADRISGRSTRLLGAVNVEQTPQVDNGRYSGT